MILTYNFILNLIQKCEFHLARNRFHEPDSDKLTWSINVNSVWHGIILILNLIQKCEFHLAWNWFHVPECSFSLWINLLLLHSSSSLHASYPILPCTSTHPCCVCVLPMLVSPYVSPSKPHTCLDKGKIKTNSIINNVNMHS